MQSKSTWVDPKGHSCRISYIVVGLMVLAMAVGCSRANADGTDAQASEQRFGGELKVEPAEPQLELSDEQWRERLSDEAYRVLRQEGTERAHTGDLLGNQREGTYHCAGCGHRLFSSDTRYDSGTGWPSFWAPIEDGSVGTRYDRSLGQRRVEVHCGRCAGHLGHVFRDGPEPTGLRYCMNSAAMTFEESHE